MRFNSAIRLTILLLTLYGCNNDDVNNDDYDYNIGSIRYMVSVNGDYGDITKGIPINNAKDTAFKDFAIYAYQSNGIFDITNQENTFFFNKNEVKKSTDKWLLDKTYYWPQDKYLSFFAFAPFNSTCIEASATVNSYPEIVYTASLDVALQPDLMIAVNQENLVRDTVKINFKHALSCIVFEATGPNIAIDSIGICGISTSGTVSLNLPTINDIPSWSNLGEIDEKVYKIGLVADAIASPEGEQIMSEDGYLMMVPQQLSESAYIIVKFKGLPEKKIPLINSKTKEWEAGKMYKYSLKEGTYEFDVAVKDTICVYSGGNYDFNINSYYNAQNEVKTPIKWSAEIVSSIGGTEWFNLDSLLALESGGINLEKSIKCRPTIFTTDNSDDKSLQLNAEISYSDIVDLSYNNAEGYFSTANCYMVNSSGWYKFPCSVMGNAVYQNGSLSINNDKCFPDNSSFIDYAGDNISILSDLNINTLGASAGLVWEDVPGMIVQDSISIQNNYIEFYVSPEALRQGNAIIAIRDAGGTIMWSWHIWVTNLNPNENLQSVEYDIVGEVNIYTHYLMYKNIGYCSKAEYDYKQRSVTVKFTQDISQKTKTITFIQKGNILNYGDNSLYYQWGRKDPMLGAQGETSATEFNQDKSCFGPNPFMASTSTYSVNIKTTINNPNVFYCSEENNNNWMTTINDQLWGVEDIIDLKYKSIYDPSPVGFQVFTKYTSKGLISHADYWTLTPTPGYQFTGKNTNVFLYAFGYRINDNSEIITYGDYGYYWVNEYSSNFVDIIFSNAIIPSAQGSGSAYGYSICPKQE